jgi:hypothetical protein
LGGKEVGGLLVNYPTVLKEKNIEKQKEYNLRYLLAKVRTTLRKSVGQAPTAGKPTQQKPCRTSSDIGAELEIILSDEVRRRIGKG